MKTTAALLALLGITATSAVADKPKYEPTGESLQQYECPDWFRDAKFDPRRPASSPTASRSTCRGSDRRRAPIWGIHGFLTPPVESVQAGLPAHLLRNAPPDLSSS